jgi:hypothetical protein
MTVRQIPCGIILLLVSDGPEASWIADPSAEGRLVGCSLAWRSLYPRRRAAEGGMVEAAGIEPASTDASAESLQA